MNTLVLGTWAIYLSLTAALLSPPTTPVISNQCEQSYRLLFKEKERDVFWIAENIYGECSQSNLLQIDVDMPEPIARQTTLKEFDKWSMMEQSLRQVIDYEVPLEVLPRNGVLTLEALGVKLRTPERNKSLEQMYQRDFASECARQWNDGMRQAGIDLPIVSGDAALQLLYISSNGLYFNYYIDKAYYFAESRIIIVFTKNNSFKCNSEISSMHGFMIFRMINV